jgi:DNA repair exonuclease SbcCD nuclease subunit
MRLVVFADLHLDTAFTWAKPDVARRRRQALRDTLDRILALAEEVSADAILCAGDLYEQDRFTPDTRQFLVSRLGAAERPVLIAPGNHDWYGPRSLYAQVTWPENVHIFERDRLSPVELADGLTVWGAAFRGPTRPLGFLGDGFRVDREGFHLGLFHGSERAGLAFEGGEKSPHAPFEAEEIERAGLLHAFVGHHHRPKDGEWHTYPGNPDPLTFGECGERGAVVAELSADGVLTRRRHVVAISHVHDVEIDVTGCGTLQDIRDRTSEALQGLEGEARVTLSGEIAPEIDFDLSSLTMVPHALDDLVLRAEDVRAGYDLDRIAAEPTVRGQFVRDVRGAPDLEASLSRRVLLTGLRALDGRDDLEVP